MSDDKRLWTSVNIMENLKLMESFKEDGIIEDYALSGGVAGEIFGEPRTIQRVEFIVSPCSKATMDRLNSEIAERGSEDELSKGKPRLNGFIFDLVPAEGIHDDALNAALVKRFPGGLKVKVVRPEYLLVMFLEPVFRDEWVYIFDFCMYLNLDFSLIGRIIKKHGKADAYKKQDNIYKFKEQRKQSIREIWHTPQQFKHKVKYHRNNARMPLRDKVKHIDHCCSLCLQFCEIRKNNKTKE